MATYQDYYELELKVGGRIVEILPSEYSFIMKDSIYELYNTLSWQLHDVSGFLQEYLATIEGQRVNVSYGNPDNTLICDFVIKSDELTQVENPGFLNGQVQGEMVNAWYDEQEVLSEAYENRISLIVRDLAGNYNFKELVINDTGNEAVWYQPLITTARFFTEILLPNCYSNNSDNTPFVCFINSDNTFNWRNFKSMYESSPLERLRFEIDTGDNFQNDQVQEIRRWRVGSDMTKDLRRRVVVDHNYQTGAIISRQDSITQYLPKGKNVPILDRNNFPTGLYDAGYDDQLTGQNENNLGKLYRSMINTMVLERMLITLPFNPKIKAGGTVTLDINQLTPDSAEDTKLSKNFSGTYLVEQCNHIWQGGANKGTTKCIIGRRYVDIPGSYTLQGSLIR